MRRARGQAGFTLIEGLLAGVLLAAAGVTVGVAVSQSMSALNTSRDTQRAAQLLDETMTKIDLIGPRRLLTEGPLQGSFLPPDERFAWQASITQLVEADLYEVTLVVTWPSPRGLRTAPLVTRIYDPIGLRDEYLQWEAF